MAGAMVKRDEIHKLSPSQRDKVIETLVRNAAQSKKRKERDEQSAHRMISTAARYLGGFGGGLIAGGLARWQGPQVLNYKIGGLVPYELPVALVGLGAELLLDEHPVGQALGSAGQFFLGLFGLKLAGPAGGVAISGDDEAAGDPTMGDPTMGDMGDPDLVR